MPQKLRCEVTQILDHGQGVYSLFLKPETHIPRFIPGQFLHLALDEYKPGDFWPDSRSFSIASSPSEKEHLRITYAAKGQFTGRMEKELFPGRQVWVKMPYGEFTIRDQQDVCLLAGGTGVTAFTAFVASLPQDYSNQVTIFYGARRPELLIYRSLVESVAAHCPNLQPVFLAEEDPDAGCLLGRIELDLIWQTLHTPSQVTYYLAGPPAMLKTLSAGLAERGVAGERIRIDAWE